MSESVLSAIGGTPLTRVTRVVKDCGFSLFAESEALDPGGSVKGRAAPGVTLHGTESGTIRADTTVIESSSGDTGIGLAQACSYFGLRFIWVVDPKTTARNIRLLEVYGAEVDVVRERDPVTEEFLQARLNRVQALLRSACLTVTN